MFIGFGRIFVFWGIRVCFWLLVVIIWFFWVNFLVIFFIILGFFINGVLKKLVIVVIVKLFGVGFKFFVKINICEWFVAIVNICLILFGLFFIMVW